jgi:hypothetical protein
MSWPSRPRSRSSRRLVPAAILAVAMGAGLLSGVRAEGRQFALVASPDVPLNDLPISEVRSLFLMKKRFWKPGQHAGILLPESGSEARAFLLARIYQMTEADLKRLVLERIYQGEIDVAPKVALSDKDAINAVVGGHGLVAIVDAGVAEQANARILKIDGKTPGSDSYPLSR